MLLVSHSTKANSPHKKDPCGYQNGVFFTQRGRGHIMFAAHSHYETDRGSLSCPRLLTKIYFFPPLPPPCRQAWGSPPVPLAYAEWVLLRPGRRRPRRRCGRGGDLPRSVKRSIKMQVSLFFLLHNSATNRVEGAGRKHSTTKSIKFHIARFNSCRFKTV